MNEESQHWFSCVQRLLVFCAWHNAAARRYPELPYSAVAVLMEASVPCSQRTRMHVYNLCVSVHLVCCVCGWFVDGVYERIHMCICMLYAFAYSFVYNVYVHVK